MKEVEEMNIKKMGMSIDTACEVSDIGRTKMYEYMTGDCSKPRKLAGERSSRLNTLRSLSTVCPKVEEGIVNPTTARQIIEAMQNYRHQPCTDGAEIKAAIEHACQSPLRQMAELNGSAERIISG